MLLNLQQIPCFVTNIIAGFAFESSGAGMGGGSILPRCIYLRLYLVVALALLFATAQGMAVQIQGLRTQVDPHYYDAIWFSRIRDLKCYT